jgi:hypothetical protein
MVNDNPALIDYVVKAESMDPNFVNAQHKKEAVIDELKAILTSRKTEREMALGRKKGSWKE